MPHLPQTLLKKIVESCLRNFLPNMQMEFYRNNISLYPQIAVTSVSWWRLENCFDHLQAITFDVVDGVAHSIIALGTYESEDLTITVYLKPKEV